MSSLLDLSGMTDKPSMYEALSHTVNIDEGHEPNLNIYRDGGKPIHGKFVYASPFSGFIKDENAGKYWRTDKFEIAYTQRGDKGPLILLMHGVPSNRRMYFPIQKRLSPFCRTISIDMLGMGESSKPRYYGKTGKFLLENSKNSAERSDAERLMRQEKEKTGINEPWDWVFDTDYVDQLMNQLYPGEKFFYVADDWGSGINSHYAAKFDSDRLLGFIQIDPIAYDSYPVSEIQAIGRASQIPVTQENGVDDAEFKKLMGAFDQTVVQILKTMTFNRHVWDQYSLRAIKHPYIDVDFERSVYRDGEDATSLTMRLKWEAIRVLADRSAILSPALLLPYHEQMNPKGVKYENITVPTLILWGRFDSMMSRNSKYNFKWSLVNAPVQLVDVPDADHFAGTDQPDFVSDVILDFVSRTVGKDKMADIFFGFDGIWKGDEVEKIEDLRKIYGINQ